MRLKISLILNNIFTCICVIMLVLPCTIEVYFKFLNGLNFTLGLGGVTLTLPADMVQMIFINIVGIDMVLISMFVTYAAMKNKKFIITSYIIARLLLAGLNFYYCYYFNPIRIFIVFGLIDFLFQMLNIYYQKKGGSYESSRK